MSKTIRDEIKKGRKMIQNGDGEGSTRFFKNLVNKHPDSAEINLFAGMTNDNLGQEKKAIPLYEKAIDLGLNDKKELRDCLVSLASSYLIEGDHENSLKAIEKAKAKFPNDPVVSSFLALTLCELNQAEKAVKELGIALLKESGNPDFKKFEKPLREYFSELDV
ncbi:tetratricopeptide (TPR) repeat protein [Virgibacillus halotolerans]|uniref:tetratricopeptide repeat protein n=1 Tax=Virgibacillus halotolerans TaxID=1071053 RepID=UPI0019620339|nr:tetratricopeptide repeat protein [Virgibacillus halotolerans]MBM7601003.1 tetratricopeptide (TPR) repeat protein [Virgibacillus halotolerans]